MDNLKEYAVVQCSKGNIVIVNAISDINIDKYSNGTVFLAILYNENTNEFVPTYYVKVDDKLEIVE